MKSSILIHLALCVACCITAQTPLDITIDNIEQELQALRQQEADLIAKLEKQKLDRVHNDLEEVGYPTYTNDQCDIVKHTAMVMCYNEKHEQPNWVAHIITPEVADGNLNRTNDFRPDPKIPKGSATKDDYWFSGYDRGHIAPSADFRWSADAISESYYYSNMSPQLAELNRERWAELEGFGRAYVMDEMEQLLVVAGGVLHDSLKQIGKNKISVPQQYYKIFLDNKGPDKKGIGFILPNRACDYPLISYAVSIDSIEQLTGINFFPKLENAEELEGNFDFSAWQKEESEEVVADVAPMPPPLPKGLFNTVQARLYVGETITVCGTVVATKFSRKSGATFLNLDKKFPNQIFSASIWKSNRTNFSYAPEDELLGKKVCFTGKISSHQGNPTMELVNEKKVVVLDQDDPE